MLNRYRAAIPSNRIDAKTASEMYRDAAGHCDLYYRSSMFCNHGM